MIITIIVAIIALPVIATFFYCLLQEDNHERSKKNLVNNHEVNCYYPTMNELRGQKMIGNPANQTIRKEKDDLEEFLDEYGKTIVKSLTEQDSFVIPIAICDDIKEKLIEWLNNKKEIQYAVLEENGIHVKRGNIIE